MCVCVCVCVCVDGEDGEGVKRRKTKIQSSIVHELRNEYLDLPEEVNVSHVIVT